MTRRRSLYASVTQLLGKPPAPGVLQVAVPSAEVEVASIAVMLANASVSARLASDWWGRASQEAKPLIASALLADLQVLRQAPPPEAAASSDAICEALGLAVRVDITTGVGRLTPPEVTQQLMRRLRLIVERVPSAASIPWPLGPDASRSTYELRCDPSGLGGLIVFQSPQSS